MYDLAELVKTIYTASLSSELAVKFFNDHSTLHYSIVQLPFGGRWTGSEDIAEYVRRWQATIDIQEMDFELLNYDEAFGTFTLTTTIQGQWKRSGQLASFSEKHFGEIRGNKIRQLNVIALEVDEILSGYFTRSEKLFNKLMKSLLENGVGLPTLELIADNFVYVRQMTRSNPKINDIIHAKERRGKQGFAEFFADLFGSVDLQFGNHKFLYGDSTEAVVQFPFSKFKLRATGVDMTGDDVACYDRFVFDEEGKLKEWSPLLSRTFTYSEFYGSTSEPI
ncbi:MAG: hypothetical protein QNJ53_14245 [Pleurocapsa sp. MO_192.B19]|nr:hypothetical protein [Pleurocapsa sp. MO_192.B19]